MIHLTSFLTGCLALLSPTLASPLETRGPPKKAVTYLGTQGPILSSGAVAKGLVYTSGTVPSLNGTIVVGGIKNETRQVIENIGLILEEAGTSWKYVLKTTVFLANMSDYTAMNEVYRDLLPNPKPARSAIQVGKLPGNFLIEIEAIAAIPEI
ncbi:hypothetical protein EJ08DRAFT_645782 [Tothia fuscella]|uniref:Uncharacterized protein n=1 Tax=Tothia fuscella TaxID=1048955 RepID=A0A9P4P1E1_9PEZI|nr:hypothetical protein EJ08DRAFT_645782 [Tothia fuscella]